MEKKGKQKVNRKSSNNDNSPADYLETQAEVVYYWLYVKPKHPPGPR